MELNRIEQTRRTLESEGKKLINLSSGNPGDFGIRFSREILEKGLEDFQKNPDYHPEPKGNPAARRAVCEFYQQRGLAVSPENILLTSGTSESYLHLFKLLAKPDEEILFPNPCYPLFDHIAKLAGIRLNHYELEESSEWQIDPAKLESKISRKTKAIVLVSPNNPTGGVLAQETVKAVMEIARKHRLAVISDEVFGEFIFEGKKFPRPADPGVNIFTLNGISKTYALPGLKLSWIAVAGPDAQHCTDELELSVDTLLAGNQISQAMLPAIMEDGENFLMNYRARLEKSRNAAIAALGQSPNITFNKPAGGFYLFAGIHNFSGTDEDFVIRMMERAGIFVHPGYFYDYEKGLHVLISFLMEAGELTVVLERFVQAADLEINGG